MEDSSRYNKKASVMQAMSPAAQPITVQRARTEGKTAKSRLYLAPQSSIRIGDSASVTQAPSSGKARRRRHVPSSPLYHSRREVVRKSSLKKISTAQYDHSDSSDSRLSNLDAPCLWKDLDLENGARGDNDHLFDSPHQRSAHSISSRRNRRHRRMVKSNSSDSGSIQDHDDASIYTTCTSRSMFEVTTASDDHSHSSRHKTYHRAVRLWWKHTFKQQVAGFWKLFVLLAFCFIVYDSRHRVKLHKEQLKKYDEERAHILEQMTWIDNAAKRVHKKYSGFDSLSLIDSARIPLDLESRNKELLAEVDQLQIRIQQNARSRTELEFGDRPVTISLPVTEGSVEGKQIVVALADDAPHAVSTLLQQVAAGVWNDVDFQGLQSGHVLQATTKLSSTFPVLEFVEKSRGCHMKGGVAVHQLESDEFRVLVLKIHMIDGADTVTGDVCIGTIQSGLDALEQLAPQVPEIRANSSEDQHINS